MGYFAGLTTPIDACHLHEIDGLPFGLKLAVYHSSLDKPSYDLRIVHPDDRQELVVIDHPNAKRLISALTSLVGETEEYERSAANS